MNQLHVRTSCGLLGFGWLMVAAGMGVPPNVSQEARPRPQDPSNLGGPFPALGVSLLSQLSPQQMDVNSFEANDCWGYVAPSGREYAIIGLDQSTAFVEITNPVSPQVVAVIPDNNSIWSDIKVYGDYAYNVNESSSGGGNGIQVIDLTQIDSGIVTLVQEHHGAGVNEAHNVAVDEGSGFLYALGANNGGVFGGGLIAFDLTDPANPSFAGAWADDYCHDAQIVTYTSGPYSGQQIGFCFSEGSGFAIVDVTDKSNMQTLSTLSYPGVSYCHQGWVSEDRQWLYVDDELDENSGIASTTRTLVFDISDLSAPFLMNTFTSGSTSIDHNLYVRDDVIFEANYASGLRIFDALDPTTPVPLAYFDTRPENDAVGFNGAWSTYPYFPSGVVIVSDIQRGLFVLSLNALRYSFPNGLPRTLTADASTPLAVRIDDFQSALDAPTATLHVSVDGAPFVGLPMTDLGGGLFEASLPAAACGSEVAFYVSASNALGEQYSSPSGAPAERYRARAADSVDVVFADDFEADLGWSVTSDACPDGTSTGQWERVDPNGTTVAPENDDTDPGARCYISGQGAPGGGDGAADVDGGPFYLVSPVIPIDGFDALIRFSRWFGCTSFNADADRMTVEVSEAGAAWTLAETVSSTGYQWVQREFLLSDFMVPGATVRVRFSVDDCSNNSVTEGGVDAFSVSVLTCTKEGIPTVSTWGLWIMALLLLAGGTILIGRRRQHPARDGTPAGAR